MPAIDLLLKSANLPDGRSGMDIACSGGKISAIERGIDAEAGRTVDATGRLVSPPFVDCHFHMDATLSLGLPRMNASGTLLEGIALWGELKPLLTVEAVAERALRYCDLAVSKGLLAIRTHVDVCDDRLTAVDSADRGEGGRSLPTWTCSWSPFRRTVFTARRTRPRTFAVRWTRASTWSAASRILSAPWRTARKPPRLCEIAAERGLLVDIHCDETDDPLSAHIEALAFETQRLGLSGGSPART
jgi:cytosine deaminase